MAEEKKFITRMGDGDLVRMTGQEIMDDIEDGVADAVRRGKVPALTEDEKQHIYDVMTMDGGGGVVSVPFDKKIVMTSDSGSHKFNAKCALPIERSVQSMIHERVLGADSIDVGLEDYNWKTVKGIAKREAGVLKNALMKTTLPLLYGAMPNLGFYTKPDGPVDNWAVLLPEGKIDEARAAQEEAVEHSVRDIVYMAEQVDAVGGDAIHLDTVGAAGDADFLAALTATEIVKEKFPNLAVSIGMSGEFVLGMHGKLTYKGKRLAGLYAHGQVELAEEAGASLFGPVVNTNTSMSSAWNIARTCTFLKECSKVAKIPLHANAGMGVCGIPMNESIPEDISSRVDKCLIEICNMDGL
jgi:dimethylamine--corrinoid protein Co-methyltransferase